MKGRKLKAKARQRVDRWETLAAGPNSTPTTKFIRRNDGTGTTTHHRPGSQNHKKVGRA